jgi:hypothetical protein
VDYGDTYPPIVKINWIMILLALMIQWNFNIHQLGVKTIILNGIYMEIPKYMILLSLIYLFTENLLLLLILQIFQIKQFSDLLLMFEPLTHIFWNLNFWIMTMWSSSVINFW